MTGTEKKRQKSLQIEQKFWIKIIDSREKVWEAKMPTALLDRKKKHCRVFQKDYDVMKRMKRLQMSSPKFS